MDVSFAGILSNIEDVARARLGKDGDDGVTVQDLCFSLQVGFCFRKAENSLALKGLLCLHGAPDVKRP